MHHSPQSIDARYRSGNALRTAGDFAAAEAEFRGVLAQAPQHRDAAYSLAFMLREQGRTDAAATVIAAWWQVARPDAESALAAVGFLIECADYERALAVGRRARALWPDDARLAARVGEAALALGDFDEARDALRVAVDSAPRLGNAWLRLAYCHRFAERDDADLARFRRAWRDTTLDTTARLCAGFALGKALDDLGDYAAAVDVLRPANLTAHAGAGWNRNAWQKFVDARLVAERIPAQPADDDFAPVFIVGLPRTGTTLVASGLARRTGVHDRGELNWIPGLYAHLREHAQLGNARALATTATMVRAQMRRDDAPARFYLDKNPLNFRYVDFIVALFPNARIVHCRRSPRDTALSLWMQHFAHEDLGFSYAFADIAAVQRGCATLMAHWRAAGIDIHDIDYEDLVADPGARMHALASALGMDSENTSQPAPSAVATASVWQVRQPIYLRSVERWRGYAPYLAELEALFDA
ncbi:MAG: sulfotransferase [Rudaea sp.]